MSTTMDMEPFEAQFSIDYDEKKLLQRKNQAACVRLPAPKLIAYFYEKDSGYSPIYQIGIKDNVPVYRVSNACAHNTQGNDVNDLIVMEPPVFPTVLLLACGSKQKDVMIRTEMESTSFLKIESDLDDDMID